MYRLRYLALAAAVSQDLLQKGLRAEGSLLKAIFVQNKGALPVLPHPLKQSCLLSECVSKNVSNFLFPFFSFQSERKKRETQMKTQINQKLEESGEKERYIISGCGS